MTVSIKFSKNSKPLSYLPWLLILFVFSCDFFSLGSYVLIVTLLLYTAIHVKEFSIGFIEIFLLFFGVFYTLGCSYYKSISISDISNYMISPWLIFWMGRNMASRSRHENFLLHLITALSIGFFCHSLLSIIYSMINNPPTYGNRLIYNFWTHQPLSVTNLSLLLCLPLGLALGKVHSEKFKLNTLFWLAVISTSIYFSFTWAHRTTVIIIGIILVYNFISYLKNPTKSIVHKFVLILMLIFAILLVMYCLFFDVGGSFTWLQQQWLFQRFTDSDVANSTGRLTIWKSFFQQFLYHPFGGETIELCDDNSFVHNLWLDIYYFCGAVPFVFFLVATVLIYKNILRYINFLNRENRQCEQIVLRNFFIAVFLNLMVEPVLQANPYVILSLLLICGALSSMHQSHQTS